MTVGRFQNHSMKIPRVFSESLLYNTGNPTNGQAITMQSITMQKRITMLMHRILWALETQNAIPIAFLKFSLPRKS